MRTYWWGCIAAAAMMMCWGAYQHVNQPASPTVLPGASEQSEQRPLDQSSEQLAADKVGDRSQQADTAPQRSAQPVAQQQAGAAPPKSEEPVAAKDESRLQQADRGPCLICSPISCPRRRRKRIWRTRPAPVTLSVPSRSDTKAKSFVPALLRLFGTAPRDQTGRYRSQRSQGHPARNARRGNQARRRPLGNGLHLHEGDCQDRVRL